MILLRDHTSQVRLAAMPEIQTQARAGRRHGRTDKPRAEVIDILNAHGHSITS